jgi:NADH kinase
MPPAFHSDDHLQIGERSRASAAVSMDGHWQASHILNPGESATVRSSLHPIPCINLSSSDPALDAQGEGAGSGKEDDWVRDINNLLRYNTTFRSKALLRHSR